MEKGTVKFFNEGKGYGFITSESGKDHFVHHTGTEEEIKQGDKVQFEIGEGKKGPTAINVRRTR